MRITWWRRLLWPLLSRKGQVAIAGLLALWFSERSVEMTVGVIGVVGTLIAGIAHEDAAEKSAQ